MTVYGIEANDNSAELWTRWVSKGKKLDKLARELIDHARGWGRVGAAEYPDLCSLEYGKRMYMKSKNSIPEEAMHVLVSPVDYKEIARHVTREGYGCRNLA